MTFSGMGEVVGKTIDCSDPYVAIFTLDENKMREVQERAHRYCFIANSLSEEVKVKIN